MRLRTLLLFVTAILMTVPLLSSNTFAEEIPNFVPDKLLCAKMIRFGQEAYKRGKFQDAKEFFRKAVTYDPNSKKAWRFYDQSVLFALAERIEQKESRDLLLPGTTKRAFQVEPRQQASSLPAAQTSEVQDLPVSPEPVETHVVSEVEEDLDVDDEEEEEGC